MKVVVCRLEDFPAGERKIVKAGPRSIGVFNVEGEFFAIRNRCPHQGGPLCIGRLSPWAVASGPGKVTMDGPPRLVACPWHGWEYDLETGQSFMGPGETRVKAYEVSVARGDTLEDVRQAEEDVRVPAAARAAGREPGPVRRRDLPGVRRRGLRRRRGVGVGAVHDDERLHGNDRRPSQRARGPPGPSGRSRSSTATSTRR